MNELLRKKGSQWWITEFHGCLDLQIDRQTLYSIPGCGFPSPEFDGRLKNPFIEVYDRNFDCYFRRFL